MTGLSPRITKRELEKHFATEGKVCPQSIFTCGSSNIIVVVAYDSLGILYAVCLLFLTFELAFSR